MPLGRIGRVSHDPSDTTKRKLKTLPWADTTRAALALYRESQALRNLRESQHTKLRPANFSRIHT
jgi:hypothetical protein